MCPVSPLNTLSVFFCKIWIQRTLRAVNKLCNTDSFLGDPLVLVMVPLQNDSRGNYQ